MKSAVAVNFVEHVVNKQKKNTLPIGVSLLHDFKTLCFTLSQACLDQAHGASCAQAYSRTRQTGDTTDTGRPPPQLLNCPAFICFNGMFDTNRATGIICMRAVDECCAVRERQSTYYWFSQV